MKNIFLNRNTALSFLCVHSVHYFLGRMVTHPDYDICLGRLRTPDGDFVDVCGLGSNGDEAAFAAAGEAAEVLSCHYRAGDQIAPPISGAEEVHHGVWGAAMTRNATTFFNLFGSSGRLQAPAGLAYRDLRFQEPGFPPTSEGCAAGETMPEAKLSAVLELIERDAVARWRMGGLPGWLISDMDRSSVIGARRTVLIEIASGLPVSVVFAASFGSDSAGYACASAARPKLNEAVAAARKELAQMELGAMVAQNNREHAPNVRREVVGRCLLEADLALATAGEPVHVDSSTSNAVAQLWEIISASAAFGTRIGWKDLTREDLGAFVVKAVSPEFMSAQDRVR